MKLPPSRTRRRRLAIVGLLLVAGALAAASGCSVSDLGTPVRMARGLVIILPGIEGRSGWNYDIARGLDEGGVSSGIEIFDWNTAIPGGALINLTDYDRNLEQARKLARRIMIYQDKYPGRSVHLIGHSGGGGMSIMTLETLPKNRKVSAAILLAAAVSPEHNLTKALRRTQYGIFNYWSSADVGFLQIGTSLFGNIDRRHGPAAGAVGFEIPAGLSQDARGEYKKLHQIKWTSKMASSGNSGSHTGWASRGFVRKYLAPLILEQQHRPLPGNP